MERHNPQHPPEVAKVPCAVSADTRQANPALHRGEKVLSALQLHSTLHHTGMPITKQEELVIKKKARLSEHGITSKVSLGNVPLMFS